MVFIGFRCNSWGFVAIHGSSWWIIVFYGKSRCFVIILYIFTFINVLSYIHQVVSRLSGLVNIFSLVVKGWDCHFKIYIKCPHWKCFFFQWHLVWSHQLLRPYMFSVIFFSGMYKFFCSSISLEATMCLFFRIYKFCSVSFFLRPLCSYTVLVSCFFLINSFFSCHHGATHYFW